jgi:predicted transcriptional regulator
MRLQFVYRMALSRGLTAKEAGAEYNMNHQSIAKCKNRYGLPSLISEYEKSDRKAMTSMSNKELESLIKILEVDGNKTSKEYIYATDERTLRAAKEGKQS